MLPKLEKASLLPYRSEDTSEKATLLRGPGRLDDPLSLIPTQSPLRAPVAICLLPGSWLAQAITPLSSKCQSQFSDVAK